MKIKYFAWIQERLKTSEDVLDIDTIKVGDLIQNLRNMGATYEGVFSNPEKLCMAVNEELISLKTDLSRVIHSRDDVTFFPPISGG